MGEIPTRQIIQVNKDFQIKQNGIRFNWHAETYKKTWKFLVLLEVSLQKTKEKNKDNSLFSLLILYMNCFSTMKRLQDYKQKSKIATPIPTPPYLSLKVGSSRIDGTLKDSLAKCYQLFPQIGREKLKLKLMGNFAIF